MPQPQTGDRWASKPILLEGGLIINEDALSQGMKKPGSAIQSINFEPSTLGGYRRINGHAKYDSTVVPGTGRVLGVVIFINNSKNGVVALRNDKVYFSQGAGWTQIDGGGRATASKAKGIRYAFSSQNICVVDGSFDGTGTNHPFIWDGTTFTSLTNAPAGAYDVAEFNESLFFAKNSILSFSAPGSENDFTAIDGAGAINCSDTIVGIKMWRGDLYIFSENAIRKLSGTGLKDYVLTTVTRNLGCIARDSIQELGGDLYYLSPDGVRTVSASYRLGDVELGSVSRQVISKFNTVITSFTQDQICATTVRKKNQYRLFTSTGANTTSDAFGMLAGMRMPAQVDAQYFVTGNFGLEWHEMRGFVVACADSYILNTHDELVVHGDFNGYVQKQENGYTLDGVSMIALYQTPYIVFDDPAIRTILQKLQAYIVEEGPANYQVQMLLDYSNMGIIQPSSITIPASSGSFYLYDAANTLYDTAIYDASNQQTPILDLVGSGFTASFTFTCTDPAAPSFTLKALNIQYGRGGRR